MSDAAETAGHDVAQHWGLPVGFRPINFPIPDDIKTLMREKLRAGEPVIASVMNEEGTTSLVATTQRIFVIRTGPTAGVTGFQAREYSWEAIADMKLQTNPSNVKISLFYHSRDGKTPETGPRAHQWGMKSDEIAPLETSTGTQAFENIHAAWHHKRGSAEAQGHRVDPLSGIFDD